MKAISDLKHRVVQHLNQSGRMLSLATIDNYAIFNAYRFLEEGGLSRVLVRLLQANSNVCNADVAEVLQVISQHTSATTQGDVPQLISY
mmetsp:Transcript_52490/g.122802  ORF Transcript_52490/g.122802 Transcript_52490/m.122802 type:complete len:89 (-) Transcript_52490:64-330(-)